ncbi:hypothetical protein niasHT_022826 [Heterodera trifolii]|uniref:Peptidase S1 domain-containing protein n=1 Tax=Heterodera trifolii TaxID=157864 RepID=A0ABD2KNV2_9BILA
MVLLVFYSIVLFGSCQQSPNFSECGISDFEPQLANVSKMAIGTNHVYKGQEVGDDKALPWIVRLIFGTSYCSGTIIGPRHILTALHCTKDNVTENQIVIEYGSANLKQLQQLTGVAAVKLHPKGTDAQRNQINDAKADKNFVIKAQEWQPNPYDMAIIELKNPIAFTATARPICLMEYDSNDQSTFVVAGWGRTSPFCSKDSKPGPSKQLVYGQMKISAPENCQSASIKTKRSIGDDKNSSNDNEHDQIICVQPGPSIIETGDSGSGLMKNNNNIWVQVGVSSKTSCYPTEPTRTEGLTGDFAPIDCAWIEKATNGEADVCYDVLAFFGLVMLGLKIALVNGQFNAVADHLLRRKLWTVGHIQIRRAKEGIDWMLDIVKDYQDAQKAVTYPVAMSPLPLGITDFKSIQITYVNHAVIAFLRHFKYVFLSP